MNENFYQFYEDKANRYVRLPNASNEALLLCLGNLSEILPRSRRATILRTERKNAASCAINFLGLTQGSKTPKSGCWCAGNCALAGRLKLSLVGLKSNIQDYSQAMRPFINGFTVMNANGSQNLCDLIADDYHAVILTGTKNFMFPREHQSKNGPNQSLQDETLAIGRLTP